MKTTPPVRSKHGGRERVRGASRGQPRHYLASIINKIYHYHLHQITLNKQSRLRSDRPHIQFLSIILIVIISYLYLLIIDRCYYLLFIIYYLLFIIIDVNN